jgi:hypothetical protein
MIRSQLLALNEEDFYHQLVAWHHMELSSPVLDSLLYMTSIRELDQAQSMWLTGDLDALDGLMAGVNPINSLESLMKQVWEIKVGTARAALSSSISLSAPPQILFSIENLEQLSAIALDTLSGHTQARYMAQSILNWSILDDRWVLAEAQEKITSLSSIEQRVKVYPNPTQGFLTIQSEDGIIAIKVYSMVGDLVHQVNGIANLSMTFDLGHLPKGGYTLQILHPDSKSSTVKVLLP